MVKVKFSSTKGTPMYLEEYTGPVKPIKGKAIVSGDDSSTV